MVCLWPDAVFDCIEGSPPDSPTDIADTCEKIRKATKGWGTDEKGLIAALGPLGPVERYHVAKKYEEEYGQSLLELMKKESGNSDFGKACQLLAQPINEAECSILKEACKGMGAKEKLIVLVVSGRTNKEIQTLKKTFFRMYGEDLTVRLAKELGGDMEKFVTACLQAEETDFDPEVHTEEKAEEDARLFDKAGRQKIGTDESTLFRIICSSPPDYLKMVNLKYVERVGYSLARSIDKELDGDGAKAATHALNMKLKPEETAAIFLESTMKGVGTAEYDLTCAVLMYQGLMGSGFPSFEKEYGKSLEKRVKGELRGDFEDLIVEMVNADVKMNYEA